MKKVFISGSIEIKSLDNLVIESLQKIIENNLMVLVGDANGVDSLIQEYFSKKGYFNVIVYTIFNSPRNLLSPYFKIKNIKTSLKGRKAQEKKDELMTFESDYSFVIWNGKSKGSFNNILRAIENNKLLKVYYEKEKRFLKKSEISIENIKKIYYLNNGIGLKELAKLTNQSIKYIKEIIKKYPEFEIINYYKGKKQIKYSFKLVEILNNQKLLFN
jgi:hypothetical protein